MSETTSPESTDPNGHCGAGNGDKKAPEGAATAVVPTGSAAPESITPRPPDQPPNEDAPESEKAALIFERS